MTRKIFNSTTHFSTRFSKSPDYSVTDTSPDSRTSTTTLVISKAIQSSTRVSGKVILLILLHSENKVRVGLSSAITAWLSVSVGVMLVVMQ